MKILIAFSSKTGNTRKIAESIHTALPQAALYDIDNAPDPKAFDLLYIGFWVDKGTADEKAQSYMQKIGNQNIALFATLGAYPDSIHATESLDNAESLVPDCQIINRFICQGSIDPKLIEWMNKLPPEHPHSPNEERVKRWQSASTHPDVEDCRAAADWATLAYEQAKEQYECSH